MNTGVITGVVTGIITGFVLSWLQFKYIWVNQRRIDEKLKVLGEAAKALALFETEAFDQKIQSSKEEQNREGRSKIKATNFTFGTDILKISVLYKTQVLYSDKAYQCLDEAFRTLLEDDRPDGTTHQKFIDNSKKAIMEMGKDINTVPPCLWLNR